jgi:hypothetical protein
MLPVISLLATWREPHLFGQVGCGKEQVALVGHMHNEVGIAALDDGVGIDNALALAKMGIWE